MIKDSVSHKQNIVLNVGSGGMKGGVGGGAEEGEGADVSS